MLTTDRSHQRRLCRLAILGTAVLVARGVGASDDPKLSSAYPPATAAIIALVGDDFFRQYITPQTAQTYPPYAWCSEHPNACAEEVRRGYSAVTYRFRLPEVSWVDTIIQCTVDVDGRVLRVEGVPDCVKDRGECVFPYDEAAAEAIAAKAGLEPGIEAWQYRFIWHRERHTYVWSVVNTLSRDRSGVRGRLVTIDANDGRVLETLYWAETSS